MPGWRRRPRKERLDILVVCTGNLCRSPIAEALLRERLGERLRIGSQGTNAVRDREAHEHVLEVLRYRAIPLEHLEVLRPAKLRKDTIEGATLILTAAAAHRRRVVELVPGAADKTFTLREFDRLLSGDADEGTIALPELVARAGELMQTQWQAGCDGSGVEDGAEAVSEDIDDPLGLPLESFQRCLEEIEATFGWVQRLS